MITRIHEFIGHRLMLTAEDGELTLCNWADDPVVPQDVEPTEEEKELLDEAVAQLSEYFYGQRTMFTIPFRLQGTEFQKKVWRELLRIPYGATLTYGELAAKIGCPGGCRAVANACGANKIDIIVPCHRVVASAGGRGGYTGGIDIKIALLEIESKDIFSRPNSR